MRAAAVVCNGETKPAGIELTAQLLDMVAIICILNMLCCYLQEREQLLSFVVVGGGPTGVEVAAELHDMVADDLRKIYPELMPYVRIRVIELQDHVLSTYDREISKYTAQEFSRQAQLPCSCMARAAGTGKCKIGTWQM